MASRYKNSSTTEVSAKSRHRFRERRRGAHRGSPYKSRIAHYLTPTLNHPTKRQRARLNKSEHVWKETDSYWKLAAAYYGDPVYWWIIAMYNQAPTESHLSPGEIIYIPTNLGAAISVLKMG